ncbi:hypothetical protein SAMN04489807_0058 [Microbacterium hydrocarbonoxydans]|uniref:Uncharacterized protein n=1 Tax=Microbacterium hydrocarbonoxydans TaxID=273678 RepID=A0A1H4IQC7_9MICO|nr:DUF6804 family protein [Microbacterium hydrocarbonoxydans]SEB35412.1 hypothetical protein SAMN04489807_0058 [Microbacterium hydrocarbonoxydans]
MSPKERVPSTYQRNALAPASSPPRSCSSPGALPGELGALVLFIASIFGLIVAWFALQARHWWWIPVFLAIAVLWNPVMPFPFSGVVWTTAQPIAAVAFLAAGATIKVIRK